MNTMNICPLRDRGAISLSGLLPLLLAGCSAVSGFTNTLTGEGLGEISKIGNGQFDIAVAGSVSGNRSMVYEKWDRTAKAACNGGSYRIIKRDWQSVEYPGLLGGIIECSGKKS